MAERTDGMHDAASVDVDAALIEEFRRVGPVWLPATRAQPRIDDVFRCLHDLPAEQQPVALCLSGGGIRSATFCLGVLQSFARSGRLRHFDYLSSVSGGGYVASWLIGWLRRENGCWDRVEPVLADGIAPHGAPVPPVRRSRAGANSGQDPVARLRAYSNFLSPVWGFSADGLSLVAIFLRNLLLNLLVWLPLLAAAVLLPRLYVAALAPSAGLPAHVGASIAAAGLGTALVVLAIAFTVADLPQSGAGAGDDRPASPVHRSLFLPLCFAPLVLAAVAFSLAGAWLGRAPGLGVLPWFMAGGVLVHLLGIAAGVRWRRARGLALRDGARGAIGVAMVLAIGAIGGALLWLALQNPLRADDREGLSPLAWAIGSVPLVLGSYWLALSLYAGLMRRVTHEDEREWWSRATGWWLAATLAWVLFFGLTLQLPLWLLDRFGTALPSGTELGLGGTLLGIATALAGYWSKNGAGLKRRAQGLVRTLGLRMLDAMAAGVIVILLLLLSLGAGWALERCHGGLPAAAQALCPQDLSAEAAYLRQQAALGAPAASTDAATAGPAPEGAESQVFSHVLEHAAPLGIAVFAAALLAVAVGVSAAIGANAFSLHGMYGNRLVRAYLGATRARRRPHWFTGFDPDDNLPLDDSPAGDGPQATTRPFHVVNIALNLVSASSRRLAWQQRKAASFTATPLRCGAEGLGYAPSRAYGGPRGMSLGRALTISGAAASPNMGYHSSALVTFVMALFNVRLGWWLPNPGPAGRARWAHDEPRLAFWTLLDEALGRTTDSRSSVYLSDGGHFENLGLYEMVRRRCHRIVVVDASCDPKYEYADLHDAVRKIRVDLGIMVDLPPELPGPGRPHSHPRLVVGRIRYSARDGNDPRKDGWLYLVKPRLVELTDPPELAHYASHEGAGDSPFPHQTTADQFFDETQFESYRLLGLVSAEHCFPASLSAGDVPQWPEPPPREAGPLPPRPAEGPCQPCCRGAEAPGAAGGLLGGLQQLGSGAALATALTVGGTLGVAGTVALAPGELRLSAEDRALLKEGLNVRLGGGELKLGDADRARLDRGLKVDVSGRIDAADLERLAGPARDALAALRLAGERLEQAAGRLGPTVPDPELRATLVRLRDTLEQLRASTGDPALPALTARIAQLVAQLEKQPATLDLDPLRRDIAAVTDALQKLKASVDAASPRRNVRGQEGGTR